MKKRKIELVSDDLTLFVKKIQASKLDQSTRVVKIDVYYTILSFKRTPGTKVDRHSLEAWIFLGGKRACQVMRDQLYMG